MSRPYTEEEICTMLLDNLHSLVDYWERQSDKTCKEKMNSLVFSILATLDGAGKFPAFNLKLDPHPSDKPFYQAEGENWYEDTEISTMLHEFWYKG